MIELLAHVLQQNHELRNQHTEAMTHLTNALNENQRLKREMWRLRRAAGEVCDLWSHLAVSCGHTRVGVEWFLTSDRNIAATVRSLSDAIGREPR